MNCEDFRQQLIRNPDDMSDAMASHMESCEPCQATATQCLEMDNVLREAMAVDVPANLGQTVMMQKILQRKRRSSMPMFAMAATVMLGIGLAAGVFLGRSTSELPNHLVAHIEHEMGLLEPSTDVVSFERVSNVLSLVDMELRGDVGRVRHVGLCEFEGQKVPHLVVHTQNGPVTVMILPEQTVKRVQSFDNGEFSGVIVPNGRGAIAIIGGESQDLEPVRQKFEQAVEYSI
ncbi:MAG: DUF3379 family protein [Gammaproteobacteria bacterium]